MIEKKTVCQIVDEWLEDKEYFLVEVIISPDDKIVVEIDHKEGVGVKSDKRSVRKKISDYCALEN